MQPKPRQPGSDSRANWYLLSALWLLPALRRWAPFRRAPQSVQAGAVVGLLAAAAAVAVALA